MYIIVQAVEEDLLYSKFKIYIMQLILLNTQYYMFKKINGIK